MAACALSVFLIESFILWLHRLSALTPPDVPGLGSEMLQMWISPAREKKGVVSLKS